MNFSRVTGALFADCIFTLFATFSPFRLFAGATSFVPLLDVIFTPLLRVTKGVLVVIS